MANQSTPGGASGTNSALNSNLAAADAKMAQINSDMAGAIRQAELLFAQSEKTSGAEANALRLKAMALTKISEQQAEMLKITQETLKIEEELGKLALKQQELSKSGAQADKDRLEVLSKEEIALKQQLLIKKTASEVASKAAQEQKTAYENLGKQQGMLGKIFSDGKASMVAYVASIASMGLVLRNLYKATQDVLDVSALSGNYKALEGGVDDVVASAWKFNVGMTEARVGLRMLGYSTEEVNASFKEFSVTAARTGGALDTASVTDLTEATGQLSRLLGVTLPESTQHIITMQQRFGASTATTAQSMLDIYTATKNYNEAAGKTVLIGRDVTKVLFDIARESRGVAVDQKFLAQSLTSNVLALQAQGKNYQESLQQASLYIKKMSTDAPDWTKVLAGKELAKKFAGGVTTSLAAQLEQSSPGLSKRIKDILSKPVDEFTKQKMLQEALGSTTLGMEAMATGMQDIIHKQGKYANATLQAIYGISATEADAFIDQSKRLDEIQAKKDAINHMDKKAQKERLTELGVIGDEAQKLYLEEKNQTSLRALLVKETDEKSAASIKKKSQDEQDKNKQEIEDLKKKRDAASSPEAKKFWSDKLAEKDSASGVKGVLATTRETFNSIQGGTAGKVASSVVEAGKNPVVIAIAGLGLVLSKLLLNIYRAILQGNGAGGVVSDVVDGIKGGKGKVGDVTEKILKGMVKPLTDAAERSPLVRLFQTFQDRLGVLGSNFVDRLKGLGGVFSKFIPSISPLFNKLGGTLSTGLSKMSGLVTKLAGPVAWGAAALAVGIAIGELLLKYFPSLGTAIGESIYDLMFGSDKKNQKAAEDKQMEVNRKSFNERNKTNLSAEDYSTAVKNHTLSTFKTTGANNIQSLPMNNLPPSTGADSSGGAMSYPPGVSPAGGPGGAGGNPMFSGASASLSAGANGANIVLDLGQITLPTANAHAYNMSVAARGVRGPAGG